MVSTPFWGALAKKTRYVILILLATGAQQISDAPPLYAHQNRACSVPAAPRWRNFCLPFSRICLSATTDIWADLPTLEMHKNSRMASSTLPALLRETTSCLVLVLWDQPLLLIDPPPQTLHQPH